MKLIDSFLFFNEKDVLKLRTEYLKDVVDYFLICECKYTFSGKEKLYYLDEYINELDDDVKNKIIRLYYEPDISDCKFEETEECDFKSDFWKIEFGQRDYMGQNLQQFSPDDLFMLSDVDEIPDKRLIRQMKIETPPRDFCSTGNFLGLYFNFTTVNCNVWPGTVFTKVETASKVRLTYLRWQRGEFNCYENAGWHFSYLGDVKMIQNKIESFSHQEYNKEEYKNKKNIVECIKNRKDLFGRNDHIKLFDFNYLPEDLRNIIVKIFPKEYYEMPEPEVITKPEYLHNNMPPLLEASLNPDGTGGTEIMGRSWQDYVLPAAPDLADWHWCVIPGDNVIAPDNSNVVWLHPHHNEPGLEQLMDKQFQKHFKAYVFVSNWQYERFGEKFNLPMEKCHVLKNATQPFEAHKKPDGKLQLIFHPNPIRGLDLLLESIRLIPDEDFELHIFHELDPDERKKQYHEGLQTYEYSHVTEEEEKFLRYCLALANADSRVVRHTRTNNSKIREQLMKTHIFAYPSIFQETSCICMIESLCAGCSVLSSNLAALPETGLGFARHYGYIPDRNKHIVKFASELKRTITEYREGKFDNKEQIEVCNKYYSWETRVKDWVEFSKQLWIKDEQMPDNLKRKQQWEDDLVQDIRYHDERDDQDFPGVGAHPTRYDLNPDNTFSGPPEISDCNLSSLHNKFSQISGRCKAILEIGIGRNQERSFAHIFSKLKNKNAIYVGLDIEDRSFLNNKENNVYTFRTDSSNYDYNLQLFRSLGVEKFDFIFIDGWHSVNQVLRDWEYTRLLNPGGIVGFHDTTCHFGPNRFVKALNRNKWDVEENLCPQDWGIGFATKK